MLIRNSFVLGAQVFEVPLGSNVSNPYRATGRHNRVVPQDPPLLHTRSVFSDSSFSSVQAHLRAVRPWY